VEDVKRIGWQELNFYESVLQEAIKINKNLRKSDDEKEAAILFVNAFTNWLLVRQGCAK
jgi:hypothetical protein